MDKTTWKFTFRDALILLVLVLVAFLFVQKLTVARELDQPDVTFEIQLRVEVKESYMLDQIQIGDKVYQKGSSVVFGEVTAVSHEQARVDAMELQNGQFNIDEPVPNNYNLLVTIKSRGTTSLNGTPIIDNNMITLNQYLVLHTNRVHIPTRVMAIGREG